MEWHTQAGTHMDAFHAEYFIEALTIRNFYFRHSKLLSKLLMLQIR